jgi:hypothetical protein
MTEQIRIHGQFENLKVIDAYRGTPNKFELSQNYPNLFNPLQQSVSFFLKK